MGMRDEIQAELAEAFDDDLADAVIPFTGSYLGPGAYDPVTEENTAQTITYTGRGLLANYDSRRIDNINIMTGDVILICLANEVGDTPAVGHQVAVQDLVSGQPSTYRIVTVGVDPVAAHYDIQLRK
jgi:hypothetical protein